MQQLGTHLPIQSHSPQSHSNTYQYGPKKETA